MLLGDAALIKRLVTFGGEAIGIQSYEGVLCAVLLERVVEGEEAGQICCVCNESGPNCGVYQRRVLYCPTIHMLHTSLLLDDGPLVSLLSCVRHLLFKFYVKCV